MDGEESETDVSLPLAVTVHDTSSGGSENNFGMVTSNSASTCTSIDRTSDMEKFKPTYFVPDSFFVLVLS